MIWQTWRQHRAEAAVGAVVLIGMVAAMLVVGTVARDRARQAGVRGCSTGGGCANALEALHRDFHSIPPFIAALVAIPLLAGMFWAAPLVSREYEAGTHRLAWSQSVSPLRWITTKLVLIFSVLALAALALGLLTVWTLQPLVAAFGGRYNSAWYDTQGIVPAACMVFALSVGVAASALVRRTIPAMAITLIAYAAARIPVHFVRVNFAPLRARTFTAPMSDLLTDPLGTPTEHIVGALGGGDLMKGTVVTDSLGHAIPSDATNLAVLQQYYCPDLPSRGRIPAASLSTCQQRLHGVSLHETVRYQPASHFWWVQATEAAIFLAIAAALVAVAVIAVTRRRTA